MQCVFYIYRILNKRSVASELNPFRNKFLQNPSAAGSCYVGKRIDFGGRYSGMIKNKAPLN